MRKKSSLVMEESTADTRSTGTGRAKLIKKRVNPDAQSLRETLGKVNETDGRGDDGALDMVIPSCEERIAIRAYERFLERGGEHGQDVTDWLEAEREVVSEGEIPS